MSSGWFNDLKKGYFDKSLSRDRRKHFDRSDMDMLRVMSEECKWSPLKYSVPVVTLLYILTHKVSLTALRNPLRTYDPSKVQIGSKIRLLYFSLASLIVVPLIHAAPIIRYNGAEFFLYQKYKHLVDEYVVSRDEALLQQLLSGESADYPRAGEGTAEARVLSRQGRSK